MKSLVSVICVCFNHKPYLEEAIDSVINQTYSNIEIILVDDASSDGSKILLNEISKANNIEFVDLHTNRGNCAAFNAGLFRTTGKYVIDFATDDVMEPTRIERQVDFFKSLPPEYGVIYSNAEYIDEKGVFLYDHFGKRSSGLALKNRSSQYVGDVYNHVLKEFFIPPPTMMAKRKVFKDLGGYDESLAYEDFDFWVRSSRLYKYAYQDEFLTKIRKTSNSYSTRWYTRGDPQLHSTYMVCEKASVLNRSQKEKAALLERIKFEIRQSVFSGNHKEADLFFELLEKEEKVSLRYNLLFWLNKRQYNLSWIRNLYHRLRY